MKFIIEVVSDESCCYCCCICYMYHLSQCDMDDMSVAKIELKTADKQQLGDN